MGRQSWETHRLTDADVVGRLSELSALLSPNNQGSLNVQLAEGHQKAISIPFANVPSEVSLQAILAVKDAVVWHFTATPAKNYLVRLQRPAGKATDTVEISYPDAADLQQLAEFLTKARALFPTYARAESIDRLLGDELAQFYRARDQALLRLEGVVQKIIEDTTTYRTRLDNEATSLRTELRAETDRRLDTLEREYSAKRQALDTERADLERLKKEIDDRDSRHARRHLRGELQTELKARGEKFTLTQSTARKRYIVHGLFGGLAMIGAAFVGLTIAEYWNEQKDWLYGLRVGLGFAGLLTTLFLYIRWNDEWFQQHAEEEFRLKRMSLDVDRASWVVEMALEWQQQNKGEIPSQLLTELTRDLFTSGTVSSSIRHPAEDLTAAVLSASSSLRMNLPGVGEATFNRRGVQKLKQAMDASAEHGA